MTWLEAQFAWPGKPVLIFVVFGLLLASRCSRDRHLHKFRGCQPAHSKAPVRDPFVGFDFIYERFFRRSSTPTLKDAYQTFRRLGSTYTVSRWTCQTIHTCDTANIKHMLATGFGHFELPRVRISVMTGLLGTGIFTLDGRAWSHARAVIRPTLTKQKMEHLPQILERHVQALLARLSSDGATLDLQPLFFGFSMDVATEFLMGHSTHMLSREHIHKEQQFVDDYMLCSEEATKKMRLGPLSWLRHNRRAEAAKKRVFEYVDRYIDASLSRQTSISAENSESGQERNFMHELAAAIADRKTLRDQVLHILLASRDTTASLLSNLFFVLAKNQRVYAKLRGEILGTVGTKVPTFEELKDMKYMKWCVNESLRLHPVIPSNAREATHDTSLPVGGGSDGRSPLFVTKGTIVLYNVYVMHRDPEVFGSKDTNEFIPERWEGLRPGWGYLPFNGGPRVCIGQQFALLETYYIVARLLQHFEKIESRDETEWMELSALATTCKNGVHVGMYQSLGWLEYTAGQ